MTIDALIQLNLQNSKNEEEVIAALLNNPSLALEANNKGQTLLHAAAREGSFKLTVRILAIFLLNKRDINVQDQDGNTALHFAYYNKHWQVVTLLLSQDADSEIINQQRMVACEKDYWRMQVGFPVKYSETNNAADVKSNEEIACSEPLDTYTEITNLDDKEKLEASEVCLKMRLTQAKDLLQKKSEPREKARKWLFETGSGLVTQLFSMRTAVKSVIQDGTKAIARKIN